MKVLVTGASGFIGINMLKKLSQIDSIELIVISRNIAAVKAAVDFKYKVTFIKDSIFSIDFKDLVKYKIDYILHLAWLGIPNYTNFNHIIDNTNINIEFCKNFTKYLDIKKLIVTGSCLEYGLVSGIISESACTNPTTHYGIAKDFFRSYLFALKEDFDFEVLWLRLFYVYGPFQSPKSLLSQLNAAVENGDKIFNMSHGRQIRDFHRIDYACNEICKLIISDSGIGVFNICSGRPISVKQFVADYCKENEINIEFNFGYYGIPDYEPLEFWGSREKLDEALLKVEKSD